MRANASLPKITLSMIRAGAETQSFQRGEAYYEDGAISNTGIQGNVLMGDCAGTLSPYYRVRVTLDEAGWAIWNGCRVAELMRNNDLVND